MKPLIVAVFWEIGWRTYQEVAIKVGVGLRWPELICHFLVEFYCWVFQHPRSISPSLTIHVWNGAELPSEPRWLLNVGYLLLQPWLPRFLRLCTLQKEFGFKLGIEQTRLGYIFRALIWEEGNIWVVAQFHVCLDKDCDVDGTYHLTQTAEDTRPLRGHSQGKLCCFICAWVFSCQSPAQGRWARILNLSLAVAPLPLRCCFCDTVYASSHYVCEETWRHRSYVTLKKMLSSAVKILLHLRECKISVTSVHTSIFLPG